MSHWIDEEPARGGYPSIEFLALSGVERMRAAAAGKMPRPPIHYLFGLTPLSSSVASSLFTMPASPRLQTGAGVFLPGTAALVADAPLGSAVLAPLGPGQIAVTSDLTINYLRPTFASSGHLSSRARPIEVGRRLGLAEAVIEDSHGELIAHSTTRCFIQTFPVGEPTELPEVEAPVYDTPDPWQRPLRQPLMDQEVWKTTSFVEICERMNTGDLPPPPFSDLFGLRNMQAKEGYFESTALSSPWFTSPAGTIYGGFLAYFADSVLTGAFNTVIPPSSVFASLDLKVSFLRPVMPDNRPIVASASIVHKGRTFLVAESQIVNADGKVVVRATSSATIIEGRSWTRAVVDNAPTNPE